LGRALDDVVEGLEEFLDGCDFLIGSRDLLDHFRDIHPHDGIGIDKRLESGYSGFVGGERLRLSFFYGVFDPLVEKRGVLR